MQMNNEYLLQIFQTFNAAKSSFLPTDEKKQLLKDLRKVYGIPEND